MRTDPRRATTLPQAVPGAPAPLRRHRYSWRIWLVCLALIAVVVVQAGYAIWSERQAAIAERELDTTNLSLVLAEHASRYMTVVDLVMQAMQVRIRDIDAESATGLRERLSSVDIHDEMVRRVQSVPGDAALLLFGADGALINYTRQGPVPAINAADRDFFKHFRDHDDSNLYIGTPVKGRVTGVWTIFPARRVLASDGRFLGLIAAAIDIGYLQGFYQATYKDQGVTLLRSDGVVLARYPDPKQVSIGTSMPAKSPWYGVVARNGGTYRSPGFFGAPPSIVAVRTVHDYPMVVDVVISESQALTAWRDAARSKAIAALIAVFSFIALFWSLSRRFGQQLLLSDRLTERNAELQASEAKLAQTSGELETTLASMDQGLIMVDPDGVVAVCNRRAFELLDLPTDLMALRPRFDAVMPLRVLQDACGATFTAAYGDTCIADDPCPQQTCVRELPNGRVVEVRSGLLASGRGWLATFEDITAKRHAEEQVVFMARHDALTLLPNRTVFREKIEAAVAQSGRAIAAAVLCLDLDNFKVVNDTLGHPVGDLLLRSVGERLSFCVRELDTVARFGGDEFAVLQFGPERAEDVALLAQRMIDVLGNPYEVDGHQVTIGVSIGIAMLPADGSDPDTLLKNADIAMYRAKDDGRGAYRFFEPEMDIRLQQRRRLELELHAALAKGEFELFFQPQVNLETGRISGFEALMRWNHPTRGLVAPSEFIHLTEEMGLIVPLGEWALRQACLEAMNWPDDIRVAVNLSPVQFSCHDLVGSVAAALTTSGLPARRLDLEITESVLLLHNTRNVQILHELRDLGVHISMDDFGTGYSSLSYLRSFPFDKIKIDQSFVRDLLDNKDAAAIVRAITAMGNSLGMVTVAEGVEQPKQLERLRAKGCTEVQGYLFSAPRPAREIPDLLHRLHATELQAV